MMMMLMGPGASEAPVGGVSGDDIVIVAGDNGPTYMGYKDFEGESYGSATPATLGTYNIVGAYEVCDGSARNVVLILEGTPVLNGSDLDTITCPGGQTLNSEDATFIRNTVVNTAMWIWTVVLGVNDGTPDYMMSGTLTIVTPS